jgi:hypothetical protein
MSRPAAAAVVGSGTSVVAGASPVDELVGAVVADRGSVTGSVVAVFDAAVVVDVREVGAAVVEELVVGAVVDELVDGVAVLDGLEAPLPDAVSWPRISPTGRAEVWKLM